MEEKARRGLGRLERGRTGGGFLPLRTISHFTYEMVNNQSKPARMAELRKRRHGCRCFRLVRFHYLTHFISEI
ncbi:MAG: hypothetical protein HFI04_01535 [Lachnospiraceae bacterium]|nr:hypothetical protein [Lachnospiraceae bacterium]